MVTAEHLNVWLQEGLLAGQETRDGVDVLDVDLVVDERARVVFRGILEPDKVQRVRLGCRPTCAFLIRADKKIMCAL